MIVVGIDGSRVGLEAAAWAAREAVLRGVPLMVAHAMPAWASQEDGGRLADVATWMREGESTVLRAAVERAQRVEPKVSVQSALLPGDARLALIKAAEGADLLVIGNHGLGGVRGLLFGSVAYGVAGHASCDVVVVRNPPDWPGGEVVVGVDGSSTGDRVLDFAFTEARLRGVALRAVHAWSLFPITGAFTVKPDRLDAESHVLVDALAGHRERFPHVEVVEEVVQGHPAEALRQAAEGTGLLVVGSRGYGTIKGMVLGSVSQAMLHHAPGPLAVVRTQAP